MVLHCWFADVIAVVKSATPIMTSFGRKCQKFFLMDSSEREVSSESNEKRCIVLSHIHENSRIREKKTVCSNIIPTPDAGVHLQLIFQ